MTAWDWGYLNGGYVIRREDMTRQVWFYAPKGKVGDVAADSLCEWLTAAETQNAQLLEALENILAVECPSSLAAFAYQGPPSRAWLRANHDHLNRQEGERTMLVRLQAIARSALAAVEEE